MRKYLQGNKKEKQGSGDRGGPRGFKKVLERYNEKIPAKPFTFFYPISGGNCHCIFDEILAKDVEFFHDTYAIHLWNDQISKKGMDKDGAYAPGSLFEQLKKIYDVY